MNAPSSTCPRLLDGQVCGGFIVSDPFAGRVCEQCGNVVEDVDVLRSEIESQHFDSGFSVGNYIAADDTGIHISHGAGYKDAVATRQHLARQKAHITLETISSQLRLANSYTAQMKNLMFRVVGGTWRLGRACELTAAACAYIICRQNGKPFSMLDIANIVMCNVFTLGRVYTRIKTALCLSLTDLDPALYIQRAVHGLNLSSEEELREVSSFAVRVINVAKRDWMVSGRRPTAIAAAALMLSLRLKSKTKRSFKEVAESLNVAEHTVRRRYREMRDLLVELGTKHLPWGGNVNKRNLFSHVPFILQHTELVLAKERENEIAEERRRSEEQLSLLHCGGGGGGGEGGCGEGGVTIPSLRKEDPPSFKASEAMRKVRQKRIDRAKRRVARVVHSMDEASRAALAQVVNISAFLALAEQQRTQRTQHTQHTQQQQSEGGVTKQEETEEEEELQELDEEDLLLEKLLLQGVHEAALLDGYYESCEQSLLMPPHNTHHIAVNGNSPPSLGVFSGSFLDGLELDDGDIPESEMFRFIKTPSEVKQLKLLQDQMLQGMFPDDNNHNNNNTNSDTSILLDDIEYDDEDEEEKEEQEEDEELRRKTRLQMSSATNTKKPGQGNNRRKRRKTSTA